MYEREEIDGPTVEHSAVEVAEAVESGPTVRLKRHEGRKPDGTVVRFDQYEVYVNEDDYPAPLRVGYVGKKPGSALCLIRRVDTTTLQKIKQEISRVCGAAPCKVSVAPQLKSAEK